MTKADQSLVRSPNFLNLDRLALKPNLSVQPVFSGWQNHLNLKWDLCVSSCCVCYVWSGIPQISPAENGAQTDQNSSFESSWNLRMEKTRPLVLTHPYRLKHTDSHRLKLFILTLFTFESEVFPFTIEPVSLCLGMFWIFLSQFLFWKCGRGIWRVTDTPPLLHAAVQIPIFMMRARTFAFKTSKTKWKNWAKRQPSQDGKQFKWVLEWSTFSLSAAMIRCVF